MKRRTLLQLGLSFALASTNVISAFAATAAIPALSADAQALLDWLARSGNHGGLPLAVVDKRAAKLWVFNGQLQPLGATPVLLGSASGDDAVPGIGTKPLAEVSAAEKTTPAGRFLIEPGRNVHGEDILWVDYDNAVSMHRLRLVSPAERRAQRMASPVAADHRITFGCINVPPDFYNRLLQPTLGGEHDALVYVLPEAMPVQRWLDRLDGQASGQAPPTAQ